MEKNKALKFKLLSMMQCWSSLKDLAFGLCLVLSKTTYKILCELVLKVSCLFRSNCVHCLFREQTPVNCTPANIWFLLRRKHCLIQIIEAKDQRDKVLKINSSIPNCSKASIKPLIYKFGVGLDCSHLQSLSGILGSSTVRCWYVLWPLVPSRRKTLAFLWP